MVIQQTNMDENLKYFMFCYFTKNNRQRKPKGQLRETGHIWYTRRKQTLQTNNSTTQYLLETIIRKYTQIT